MLRQLWPFFKRKVHPKKIFERMFALKQLRGAIDFHRKGKNIRNNIAVNGAPQRFSCPHFSKYLILLFIKVWNDMRVRKG